jgi:hypothetical protein
VDITRRPENHTAIIKIKYYPFTYNDLSFHDEPQATSAFERTLLSMDRES